MRQAINLGLNFGGESLLHPKFSNMLEYAASKGCFRIGFHTNGVLLNKDIVRVIIDNGIDHVYISLDGLRDLHESLRTGSDYNLVEQNIINLVRARGANSKPKIAVDCAISTHTDQDITEFINYWVKLVDAVRIYPCQNENLQLINRDEFYGKGYIRKPCCIWPFEYLAVLWNGDVSACCHDIAGVNVLGNIVSKKIMDVWKGKSLVSMRQMAIRNSFPSGTICSTCNSWQIEFSASPEIIGEIKAEYVGLGRTYQLIRKEKR